MKRLFSYIQTLFRPKLPPEEAEEFVPVVGPYLLNKKQERRILAFLVVFCRDGYGSFTIQGVEYGFGPRNTDVHVILRAIGCAPESTRRYRLKQARTYLPTLLPSVRRGHRPPLPQ